MKITSITYVNTLNKGLLRARINVQFNEVLVIGIRVNKDITGKNDYFVSMPQYKCYNNR